ncbi:MAG: hypothetical protein H7Y32_14130 [Chloroflexales bacterium]|nr:hypothetical protein [Chloroflexales bacterium]
MYPDTDPVRTCAQAITLGLHTIGGWTRWPAQRIVGVVATLCAAAGALALFGYRTVQMHRHKRSVT